MTAYLAHVRYLRKIIAAFSHPDLEVILPIAALVLWQHGLMLPLIAAVESRTATRGFAEILNDDLAITREAMDVAIADPEVETA